MRIFRVKEAFRAKCPDIGPKGNGTRFVEVTVILKGTTFIVENTTELPDPIVGGITDMKEVYEEIVPKNMLIKLDSFVKVKSL